MRWVSRVGLIFATPLLVIVMLLFAFVYMINGLVVESEGLYRFWLKEWRNPTPSKPVGV